MLDAFTFHYVSINITFLVKELRTLSSLHSTMYLLICTLSSIPGKMADIFTFHYVSINIATGEATQETIEDTLHSTMYLLISFKVRPEPQSFHSLHSTMYLLISKICEGISFTGFFTFHYVSINI